MIRLRLLGICLLVALVASLGLARVHPFGNAGLYEQHGQQGTLLNEGQDPSEVRALLVNKCADCHSNQTRAPLYGRFAPASWLMERDIVEARSAMNLSAWESYSTERRQTLAGKMAREVKAREMPPLQYRAIHWNAAITESDAAAIAGWARALQTAPAGAVPGGAGDATRGQTIFEQRCIGCHTLDKNSQGPALRGVYGRASGTASGYAYTPALKKAAVPWDERSLDRWLADPDQFLPGNNMDFLVSRQQERADVIAFLKKASGR